jgi:hypothetical protein
VKLADTQASVVAGLRWADGGGIRGALAPYGLTLEDVGEWSRVGMVALLKAPDERSFEGRFVGAIAAAIIVGIELGRSGEAS